MLIAAIAWVGFSKFHNTSSLPVPQRSYDVVVVGAGPGGIAAAMQAARMGAHVALLEPTDWIGGQMTAAGVGTMDEGNVAARKSGLYKEFVARAQTYYAARHKSLDTCYYETDSLCVDPAAGQTILWQMLHDAGANLAVFTNVKIDRVTKHGNTVTGVVANGRPIASKVLVDADEYGDVLAQAGADYRLGTGTSTNLNPASCIQSITYSAIIKYYPNGVPPALQFHAPPPGYSSHLAAYFAAFLRQNGYDHFVTHALRELSFSSYAAFRGLPDLSNQHNYDVLQKDGHTITRTALNLGNDYPPIGDLRSQYITDPAYRRTATCKAKLETIQLIYYIQHDLGQPQWSVADDEGYDTPYNRANRCAGLAGYEAFEDQLPVEPYVREGRRLIGEQTITGDQLSNVWKNPSQVPRYADSIAVGYYPMDLHGCHQPLEPALDTPDNLRQAFTGGAFEVPLGALVPIKVDGLLAAEKNISVSRQANGALREQPIAMATGQAAGALAALAAKSGQPPRMVPYQDVQAVLKAAGVITSL